MYLTGRAAIALALGIIPIVAWPSAETVGAWILLVAFLALIDVLLATSPRALTVTRTVPASVRMTEQTRSTLLLVNDSSRRFRGVVRDAWPPSAGTAQPRHDVFIPAYEAIRATTALQPTRRGDRHADRVTIRSIGPLRLAGRQRSVEAPARLRVLPEFASRRHLPSRLAMLREMDGQSSVNIRGAGTEFDSLREYVDGDDVRSIDWRSTARRGDVVVRTWRPERDRRVFIVLDSSRLSAVRLGEGTRMEAHIEAALLLSALAASAGDRVEVVAIDRRVRAHAQGSQRGTILPALAHSLAPVEPALVESNWPLMVAETRTRMTRRALVVLLTAPDPTVVEEGLLPVIGQLTKNHLVVVASATDPEVADIASRRDTSNDVYAAAAAERVALERDRVSAILRQRGATVLEAGPDSLPTAVADLYLSLKAAGRL